MEKNFGELLKEFREARGLTGRKLLELLWDTDEFDRTDADGLVRHKYNEPDVSKWESGTTTPPANVVEALEDVLPTPKGLLLEAAGYHAEATLRKLREGTREGRGEANAFADLLSQWKMEGVGASKLYQEHQNGMLHLVERLKAQLEPHLSEFRLRNLGRPSTDSSSVQDLPIGSIFSLSWQVSRGRSVSLYHGLELAEDIETNIMRGYLEQHLHSSSYRWLIEDNRKGINEWKRLVSEELKGRTRLLRQIDREVNKLTGKLLSDPNRMNYTGPSTWFSDSIWAAVLDGRYRTLDYNVEPIDNGLFKALYGATFIGLTITKEEGEQYGEWHKKLMAKSGRSRTVKAINQLKKERESVTKGIREVLAKFVVDKHVPGKCNYEFCR